jgi:ribonuclease E
MSHPSDPSHEMYSDDLSPDDVEALLSSGFGAPADAGLHQAIGELRALPELGQPPAASAELAAFFDVHLTPSPEPALDLAAPVVELDGPTPVHNVRRLPMIGQLAAFLGTLGGKICVGTTVAAASFGGAAATGVVDVDVPFFEDEPAQVETIEPDEPDAVAFVEEDEPEVEAQKPDPEPERAVVEIEEPEEEKIEPVEVDAAEEPEKDEPEADALIEEEQAEEPAPLLEPKEEPKAEEPKEEPKAEEPKDESKDDKHEEPKDESEKTPEQEALQEQIGALDEALHVAKDAVRAEATALIQPLENQRKELVEALEAELEGIAAQWEPVIADLEVQLEAAETDEEYLEIQADLEAALDAWEDEHIAAELNADPDILEIDAELERIELERDEELNRLIGEFLAAVEALENA